MRNFGMIEFGFASFLVKTIMVAIWRVLKNNFRPKMSNVIPLNTMWSNITTEAKIYNWFGGLKDGVSSFIPMM